MIVMQSVASAAQQVIFLLDMKPPVWEAVHEDVKVYCHTRNLMIFGPDFNKKRIRSWSSVLEKLRAAD